MILSHSYTKYGLDSAKCWTVCIMQLFRVGVLDHGEFSHFFHPNFLEGEPVTDREKQIVSIVNQILSDEGYFLALAKREGVPLSIPNEPIAKEMSEEESLTLIRKDPSNIRLILNPSPEVQMEALNKDISVLKHIKTPCFEALMKINGLGGDKP